MGTPLLALVEDSFMERLNVPNEPARALPPAGPATREAQEDANLVLALRGGQQDATELLWRRHASMVRGILRRLLGPDQDVEDLLQETFIQFFRNIRSLRDPFALRMFLIRITTNVVRGELRMRRVRRWVKPTDTGTLPDLPGRPLDVESRHALQRFYAILDELSAYDRTAFVLRFVEDFDLTEVAEALGVSLATVKRHLSKIAARVKEKVDEDDLLRDYIGRAGHELPGMKLGGRDDGE